MKDSSQRYEQPSAFVVADSQYMSLLQNMAHFLTRLSEEPLPLSGTRRLPAAKWLESLNTQLLEPDTVTLARPQSGHFPAALGLYLLARACDLGRVDVSKSKHTLVLNQPVFAQWQVLTSEERYFNLLEAFFNRLYSSVIGGRSGIDGRPFLDFAGESLWGLKEQSPEAYLKEKVFHLPMMVRRFHAYTFSLFAMFGIAEVALVENGKELESFCLTPWGRQLMSLCHAMMVEALQHEYEGDTDEYPFVEMVQKYRPSVQSWLSVPTEEPAPGFLVKVSFGKECWRKLSVSSTHTLDDVAMAILQAFKFDDIDHLYHFEYADSYGVIRQIGHEAVSDVDGWADQTTLGDIQPTVGMALTFVFDYGEDWCFQLSLEEVSTRSDKFIDLMAEKGAPPRPYED